MASRSQPGSLHPGFCRTLRVPGVSHAGRGPRPAGRAWRSRQLAAQCLLSLALLLLVTSGAFADTVKVTVDRALVWSRPSGVAVVITQLMRNDTAEVVRRVGGWYEIVVPTGTLGAEFRTGFIVASQVVIDTVGPPSADVLRATTPAPPQRPTTPGTSFLNIDGVRRRGRDDLTQTVTVFSSLLAEDSTIKTNYGDTTGWSFDFMGGGAVWHSLGVGFGVGYHQRDRSAAVDALLPHPFFFDTFRAASFTTEPLRARETAFHIPAVFIPPAFGPIKVLVFAGPSVFRLSQTVVTDVTLNEQSPYDTVTISGVITEERKGTFLGYHAGADVSVFFNRSVGVGGGVRYSRASVKEFEEDAATTTGITGGVSAVGGVRFRF